MKSLAFLAAAMLAALDSAPAAEKDTRVYVLSTVFAKPGKLEELHAVLSERFLPLATKRGVTFVGAFVPVENPNEMLFFIGSGASLKALQEAGGASRGDREMAAVVKSLTELSDSSKQADDRFVQPTDFSPAVAPAAGKEPRVFELRTYTTTPGNLPLLHARFRDHTLGLFAKHGMTNLWYWQLEKGQSGADNTLIYMLAHPSVASAATSFAAFRADPAWIEAKAASEKKGGGSLTVPDGVKSVFLKATDYSPIK